MNDKVSPEYYHKHLERLAQMKREETKQRSALLRFLVGLESTALAVLAALLPTTPLSIVARLLYFVALALQLLSILVALLALYGLSRTAQRGVKAYERVLSHAIGVQGRVEGVFVRTARYVAVSAGVSVVAFVVSLLLLLAYSYCVLLS